MLRSAALAVQHDLVDELGHNRGPVYGIGQNLALGDKSTTGHLISSFVGRSLIASVRCKGLKMRSDASGTDF